MWCNVPRSSPPFSPSWASENVLSPCRESAVLCPFWIVSTWLPVFRVVVSGTGLESSKRKGNSLFREAESPRVNGLGGEEARVDQKVHGQAREGALGLAHDGSIPSRVTRSERNEEKTKCGRERVRDTEKDFCEFKTGSL